MVEEIMAMSNLTMDDLMEDEYHRYLVEENEGENSQLEYINGKITDVLEGIKEDEIKKSVVFKSYKEMCERLNIANKTGSTKKRQLKELEAYYFDYVQKGYSFEITNVHNLNDIQKKTRTLRANYKDYIEELIISIMIDEIRNREKVHERTRREDEEENSLMQEEIIVSQTSLAKAIGMVNKHYGMVTAYPGSYCKQEGYSRDIFNDWSSSFKDFLKRSIKNAVSSLRDKRLIIYEMRISVCEYTFSDFAQQVDGDGDSYLGFKQNRRKIRTRLATPREKSAILKIEKDTLNKFHVASVSELFKTHGNGGYKKYTSMIDNRLRDELQIRNYFLSYALSFSEDIIENYAVTEDIDFKLTSRAKSEYEKQMNKMVRDKVQQNVNSRKTKAIQKNKDDNYMLKDTEQIRLRGDYVSTCDSIADDILNPSNRVNHSENIRSRKAMLDANREKRQGNNGY